MNPRKIICFFTVFFVSYFNSFTQNYLKINKENIYFNDVNEFESINGNIFKFDNIQLITDANNCFTLKKKGIKIADIPLDIEYEGPGYNIYNFSNKGNKNLRVILIEASADIGVAWYFFIFMEGDKIIKKNYIKEPRHNSDFITIKDFLKISYSNKTLTFRFVKKYIAKYSKIPKTIKKDNTYMYVFIHI